MKRDWTKLGSLTLATLFGGWIVWMWIAPPPVQHMERPEEPNQQTKAAPPPSATPTVANIYRLPTPPKPKAKLPVKATPLVKVAVASAPPKSVAPEPQPQKQPVPIVVKPEKRPLQKKVEGIERVEPKQETPPKPVEPEVHEITVAEATSGRALLRVLEHGKGPLIEIAWPAQTSSRNQLYTHFKNCFGMENALMDADGNLFRASGQPDKRWEINLDRYSGFLRQASGQLPRAERSAMRRIQQYHGDLRSPVPVRIFPRRIDASLLGGLKAIVGSGYAQAKSIQAQYQFHGGDIHVGAVRVDGRMVDGRLALPKKANCRGTI